jgi:hypothetical protein
MKKEDFKQFVEISIDELLQHAQKHLRKKLPEQITFQWHIDHPQTFFGKKDIIDEITQNVYIDEDRIFPCVELIIQEISPTQVFLVGRIAGYCPRPFQNSMNGKPGPFVYCINKNLLPTI